MPLEATSVYVIGLGRTLEDADLQPGILLLAVSNGCERTLCTSSGSLDCSNLLFRCIGAETDARRSSG